VENKGMLLYGCVIMSNHIHLIIQSKDGKLSDLIRDFKKFTAKKILENIQTDNYKEKGIIEELLYPDVLDMH
jgi:REP element-mobilizing transposase RayT